MIRGMPIGFLASVWLADAGLLVGFFEAVNRWGRSEFACVIAVIMFLLGAAGLSMTWKRAARTSYCAAVRKRRKLGIEATLPPLHPLVLGKLLSEIDADETSDATDDVKG
jgi:hypothetical protein